LTAIAWHELALNPLNRDPVRNVARFAGDIYKTGQLLMVAGSKLLGQ